MLKVVVVFLMRFFFCFMILSGRFWVWRRRMMFGIWFIWVLNWDFRGGVWGDGCWGMGWWGWIGRGGRCILSWVWWWIMSIIRSLGLRLRRRFIWRGGGGWLGWLLWCGSWVWWGRGGGLVRLLVDLGKRGRNGFWCVWIFCFCFVCFWMFDVGWLI